MPGLGHPAAVLHEFWEAAIGKHFFQPEHEQKDAQRHHLLGSNFVFNRLKKK